MRGEVVVRGAGGERTIPIDDFLQGPFTTALRPGEIVTEVRVPDPGARSGGTYLKLERKVGDFATVGVAVHVALANGGVGRVGIAMTGVGPINVRAEAAEAALAGRPLDDDAIAEAGRLAAEAAEPLADVRGSVEYKKNAIRVLTERGLRRAVEAAREQPRDDNEQFAGHETVEGVMNEIEEKDQ
jgi:carbon-monoxide dehydrogenase medium subunit